MVCRCLGEGGGRLTFCWTFCRCFSISRQCTTGLFFFCCRSSNTPKRMPTGHQQAGVVLAQRGPACARNAPHRDNPLKSFCPHFFRTIKLPSSFSTPRLPVHADSPRRSAGNTSSSSTETRGRCGAAQVVKCCQIPVGPVNFIS